MNESLFASLSTPDSVIALNMNYRMNRTVTNLANILTYQGRLVSANETVADSTLEIPHLTDLTDRFKNQRWILRTLDTSLEAAVKIIDTGSVWKRLQNKIQPIKSDDSQNFTNRHEAAIVKVLVHALIKVRLSCF